MALPDLIAAEYIGSWRVFLQVKCHPNIAVCTLGLTDDNMKKLGKFSNLEEIIKVIKILPYAVDNNCIWFLNV